MGKKNEKKNWLTYLGYICIIVIISLIVCIVLNEFNNTSKTIQTGGLMTISDMATTNISGSNYSSRTDTSNDYETKDATSIEIKQDKLVYFGNVEIETKNYDEAMEKLKSYIADCGGVIVSQEGTSDKNTGLTAGSGRERKDVIQVRIPAEKFDEFMDGTGNYGQIISKASQAQNISESYHDIEGEIETLEKEKKKLNSLLESCNNMEDFISVDTRLSEVQSELNEKKNILKGYDQDVAYSYVSITVEEVIHYSKGNVSEIFKYRFYQSWNIFISFMMFIIEAMLSLTPFLLILVIVYIIFYKKIKEFVCRKKHDKNIEIQEYKKLEEKIDVLLSEIKK